MASLGISFEGKSPAWLFVNRCSTGRFVVKQETLEKQTTANWPSAGRGSVSCDR